MFLKLLILLVCSVVVGRGSPYMNPYFRLTPRYNYPQFQQYYSPLSTYNNYVQHSLPNYNSYTPSSAYQSRSPSSSILSQLNTLPTINIFAQRPYNIERSFTVVPLLVVAEDNLNMITDAHVISVSKKKPAITIQMDNKDTIQCTPAVKIELETPLVVYNLKTSIMFPSQMSIRHENVRIPIRVGAVVALISSDVFVSEETPVSVDVVYAIPTKPVQVDYVNNDKDVLVDTNAQSVIVESSEGRKNGTASSITTTTTTTTTAAPHLVENEEESELENRNPPTTIVADVDDQTTQQPITTNLDVFLNSKESPVLMNLREESIKKRI